jgi:hypothetical protein
MRCIAITVLASILIVMAAIVADATPILTSLLSPREADALGIRRADELAVGPRGEIVIGGIGGAGVSLFVLGRREPLAVMIDDPLRSCAFAPDGALLAVAGRSLGFVAGGRFRPQVRLPEERMRVVAGEDRLYLFGGSDSGPSSLYALDPDRGTVKLATFPRPVGAADVEGETVHFSVANDLYRLVPGGELRLLCRVPGPEITGIASVGIASVGNGTIFFLAGRTLYRFDPSGIAEVAGNLGDRLARRGDALYILDRAARTLVRFEGLDAPPTVLP